MVFSASNLGVWLCLRADPRKLKREKVQNPTSAKIATLENFPLYGTHMSKLIVPTYCMMPLYFPIVAIPYCGGLLGSGSGPILYAYLNCIGNETLLSQCRTFRSLTLGTAHFSDAGVRCLNESKSIHFSHTI